MDAAHLSNPGRPSSPESRRCVLGVDAGGSNLRTLIATFDGVVLARSVGTGANVYSSGPAAIDNLCAAIQGALGAAQLGADDRLEQIYIAAAGALATESDQQGRVTDQLHRSGITAPLSWASDVTVVVPGATTEANALVAAVGTGSVFARVEGFVPTTVIGGHGWLVGDEGSAVAIGRAALRHTFAVLDGIASPGPLAAGVLDALSIGTGDETPRREQVAALTTAVYGRPPAQIGTLAPLVVDAIDTDNAARAIADQTVDDIIDSVGHLAPDDEVIVAAGSIIAGSHRLAALIRDAIERAWPRSRLVVGTDGAAGAAALAINTHDGLTPDRHARLLAPPPESQDRPEPQTSRSDRLPHPDRTG